MTTRTMRALLAAVLAAGAAAPPLAAQRIMEIQVAPPLLRLRPGALAHVLATAYDRDGIPVNARLVWSSTNINVATVDSLGRVYAVSPGIAVITATTDSTERRRRYGRSTVFVSSTSAWGTGAGHKTMPVDTVPPPECDDPGVALRNPGRACWDVRPTQRANPVLERPASCPYGAPAIFQVRVGPDGRILERRTLVDPGCEEYLRAAAAIVDSVCCTPAYRHGRPVTAWTMISIRPPYRTRVYVTPPAAPAPMVPGVPRPDRTPAPAPDKQGPRP